MNAFITGASGGLGRVMALECASRGYNLFLTDLSLSGLESIKWGIEHQYSNVSITIYQCDLTNQEAVDNMLAFIDESDLRFDMLLNIAGLDFEGGFLQRSREELVKIATVNDAATLRITHSILNRRVTNDKFTIIFVSSLAALFPMPLKATYAASKRFILDMSIALHHELRSQKVNVLSLCPAGMLTTQENVLANAAQGLAGEITINDLEKVARNTISHGLRGDYLYIPGIANKAILFISKILPASWAAAIIRSRWEKTQKSWLKIS